MILLIYFLFNRNKQSRSKQRHNKHNIHSNEVYFERTRELLAQWLPHWLILLFQNTNASNQKIAEFFQVNPHEVSQSEFFHKQASLKIPKIQEFLLKFQIKLLTNVTWIKDVVFIVFLAKLLSKTEIDTILSGSYFNWPNFLTHFTLDQDHWLQKNHFVSNNIHLSNMTKFNLENWLKRIQRPCNQSTIKRAKVIESKQGIYIYILY